MRNRPKDLIGQLKAINVLDGPLKGYRHFVERYCNGRTTRFGYDIRGAAHMDELNRIMRMNGLARRDRRAILPQLPSSQWQEVLVEITNPDEYAKAETDLVNWVRAQVLSDASFLRTLNDMSMQEQVVSIAKEQRRRERGAIIAEWLVRTAELRKVTARGKLQAAVDWIEQMLEDDEPIIVFAHHREIQIRLAERFQGCLWVSGGMSDQMRFAQIQKFRKGDSNLIVLSLHAAGEGIDGLQDRCCHALFVELDWSPAVMDQAFKRLDRIGQTQPVTAWRLVGADTIDVRISHMLSEKLHNIRAGIEVMEDDIPMALLRALAS